MSCNPEVVGKKQVNNEQVAYNIVCCEEKCSPETCTRDSHSCEDSWHAMSIHIEDHEPLLAVIKAEVAARHEKMKTWRAK